MTLKTFLKSTTALTQRIIKENFFQQFFIITRQPLNLVHYLHTGKPLMHPLEVEDQQFLEQCYLYKYWKMGAQETLEELEKLLKEERVPIQQSLVQVLRYLFLYRLYWNDDLDLNTRIPLTYNKL